MERQSHTVVVEKPQNTPVLTRPKVCMHVLGTGRTDARVLREAKALEQAGYDVMIIDIEEKHTRPGEETLDGIRFKHFFMTSWYIPTHVKLWFLVKVVRVFISATFMLLKTPADIYHAHEDNALFACYLVARLHRKPLVFDSHELPFVSPRVTRWHILHACATRLLKVMMPRCTAVISPSPPLVQELQTRYGGREALIIRNIPPYQPPLKSDRLRHHLALEPQARIALYQGGLQDDRGLDMLVRAAHFLDPNNVIVLMGKGESHATLQALIAQEGVERQVKLLPAVPYAELLTWTASADLGLIIYQAHSANVPMMLPNKLFEYLMAGVPVLSSPLEAVVEIVDIFQVGKVVSSLDPRDIAQAMNSILADQGALARFSANALAASKHELCWEIESQRLIQLYQSILGNHCDVSKRVQ